MSSATLDTRTAILEAAWKRLIDRGPDGLKLGAVAADAGVSRQAVYLHFGSRAGVLVALVEYIDGKLELGPALADAFAADDPVEQVRRLLRVSARYAPKIQDVALAIELSSHSDPDVAQAFTDRMNQRRVGMRAAVSGVAAAGRLAPEWTVDQVVDVIWALGRPTFFETLVGERQWNVDDFERYLVSTFERLFVVD